MDDPLNIPPITAHLSLMVDAMYLNGAERAFVQVVKGSRAVERAMRNLNRVVFHN